MFVQYIEMKYWNSLLKKYTSEYKKNVRVNIKEKSFKLFKKNKKLYNQIIINSEWKTKGKEIIDPIDAQNLFGEEWHILIKTEVIMVVLLKMKMIVIKLNK